ncbi:unnamed protein product [Acanthoscelides obtectus]|uniref:Uncharacterized protein n=1 Tax=Acanthoscelides obtectus TaxID=200917 RepID=A0A9P0KQY9_ACAOB|nr:unnamed protein product [Acanthoscelides obtectus]CAK1667639.1 Kv channel-interacting protein 1 [Acanthoscelides obtectus]
MQECPEGVVHEDSFKEIYSKFFPHGIKPAFRCLLKSQVMTLQNAPYPCETPPLLT